jgi:phenylalanyl-tRNA synthetase beta chain
VLGAEIPKEEVERILGGLGFAVERRGPDAWRVTPPSFRLDATREVDLVEEIARHYGYDRLPARVRTVPPRVEKDAVRDREHDLYTRLVALGYQEIIPSSMVDPAENAHFADRPPVVLANPLSQEASALRSSTVPSMLRALRWNLDRGQDDLRLFEMGKTYSPQPEGLADERRVLTLGLSGYRRAGSVHESPQPLDIFDLKGDLESLWEAADLPGLRFEAAGCRYYEPGQGGRFTVSGKGLAIFGQINHEIGRDYKLRQAIWLAEIDLEALLGAPARTIAFRGYSKFPAVERDFSLVIPDKQQYREIEDAVRDLRREEIRGLRPVDFFRGGAIAAGHYSLLLRVTFQSPTHTLTSQEVSAMSQQILDALAPLGVRLRT